MKKSIDFLITQKCNYRCEYCSQSKKYTENLEEALDDTIEAFLNFLDTIDKSFVITISGGEPLCHPKFFFLVSEIVKKGFKISVVSNFSFPIKYYIKLKEIAGNKLEELFVSLHLSQLKDKEEFLKKVEIFNIYKKETNFVVGSVLTEENLEELKYVADFLKRKGVKFELQHMRIKNSYVKYKDKTKEFIEKYPISKIKEKSNTYGKICHAGVDFLFIYQNGEAYRCYSSRFNKVHSLGNIKDKNFKLYSCPIPCLNKNCTCPKPIINGLIEFDKTDYINAIKLSSYNYLWFPYFAIKNFKILKAKFLQGLKFKK